MSKKETVEEFKAKLAAKQKQLEAELAKKAMEADLDLSVIDVIQDPTKKTRSFLAVKIKYDLVTKTASVVEILPFEDKTAGLSIQMGSKNLEVLFEKNRRR